ncbi:MAG TPA: peptidoglycan recognition protein, partial [Acidimicrobiales bacterium]|nr:peptidoglycan recognition protein [Acidimicrobiales bacterium]
TDTSTAPAAAATTAQPQPVPQPTILPRSYWGADESIRQGTPEFAPETRMAVHHTAGPEGADPSATIRAIYAYHVQVNGWNDIGYNFLIDSSGRIYEGRHSRDLAPGEVPTGEDSAGDGVIGAHTLNNNTGTVGVAFLGDFTSAVPTPAAFDALQRLLAWKADRHGIDPMGTTTWSTGPQPTIIGHRDAYATECPGQALYDRLPGVRTAVSSLVASARSTVKTSGYWILAKDTGVYSFGDAPFLGGPGAVPAPAMSMASTPSGQGYWLLSSNGHVGAYGDAAFHGSTENMRLNSPAVRLEPTRTGLGYWVLAADGGVFSFGDAAFYGSTGNIRLNAPVVSMSTTTTGRGYWLLAKDGGVFSFGDAAFWGSTGNMRLNAPVQSMAPHPSGAGYWLQASDGGIFSFGPAVRFYGSVPGLGLRGTAPTSQIRVTPSGNGYYVLGSDGGIFAFGDAGYFGAEPGLGGTRAAVDLALRNAG